MIAIVKYNAGNIASVQNALNRLGFDSIVTDESEKIRDAEKVIFPGVGEAGTAMRHLKGKGLDSLIPLLAQPVLGICLGMQLMCTHCEEGDTQGLDIFKTNVKRFPPIEDIPHMGWNNLSQRKGDLFKGISETDDFYFVHSYYAENREDTSATCDYILPFAAALQNRNFYGTQFHPEKSGAVGEKLLMNFLKL